MFNLDILIVTFKRPKFLRETIKSFLKIVNNYNFRLTILDGGNDEFKEYFNETGTSLSTKEMLLKFFHNHKLIYYKQYNNNGDWALILDDYINNICKAKNFVIVGDDDLFIDLKGFYDASEELNNNEEYSICNIHYKDNIIKNFIETGYDLIDGKEYVNRFIQNNFINTQSVIHIFKTKKIKNNNTLYFLRLRDKGLEDFFGWDMYFLFFTAITGKIKYLKTNNVIEMGAQGNEIRYTVAYPLTQWICYYLYSKYTLNKLLSINIINNKTKKKFLLHWVDSFFICYSKYLFSEYPTKNIDHDKVKNYLKTPILLFITKEILSNGFLINIIIIKRISWIIFLKILPIKIKYMNFFKKYVKKILLHLKNIFK
jgi:hypothetical protein